MTNTCIKIFSGSQPCHYWATKWWFRDPPFLSSGSMCTVTENQRYVRQSVLWVFLLLVCWVMVVENAMQHTPLPPQTLLCVANPKKSSSNYLQAFICHSLMWSYRRILAFTVTKCNKVFSGNQHHKHGVYIQHLRFCLYRQERVTHHIRNNELERKCKELLCLIVCNY